MKKKIVYKVVSPSEDGLFWSCYAPSLISLNYKLGRLTRPKIKHSQIFVFKRLKDAKIFRNDGNVILRCTTDSKLTRLKYRLFNDDPCLSLYIYKIFWSNIIEYKYNYVTPVTPSGTYGVTSLTPIAVVK